MTDNARDTPTSVPPQALLLSLLSLWVPVLSASIFPDWTTADVGILVWLLALIPPFLLSYYRGWKGASVALAAAMAAFAISQVVVTLTSAEIPSADVMLGISAVLITVSLASGVLATIFHKALNRAEQTALTDPGTGLPNRRHGVIHLQRAFAAAERGTPLSVVLFDLDRFKSINDRFGHRTGDEVLDVFARVLDHHTRAMNLTVRFGGEEFLAILDGVDAEGAEIMAERVREDLRKREFPWGHVTVSAGISEYERGMATPDILVAAADQALYRAKAQGRDRVVTLARKGAGEAVPVAPRGSAPGPDSATARGHGELILVVDDDPAVLKTLARALRRRGYRVMEAAGPVEALRTARQLMEPIDLLMTDVVMPEMSGFRLVEMLLDEQPELRALYISGYSAEEVSWSGVPGAVKAFLPKPISLEALTAAVRSSLDAPLAEEAPAGGADEDGDGGEADALPPDPERVALLSRMLARELGLPKDSAARIEEEARAIAGSTAAAGSAASGTSAGATDTGYRSASDSAPESPPA